MSFKSQVLHVSDKAIISIARFTDFVKMPLRLASKFYYRSLNHNRDEALPHIHNCTHINSVLKEICEVKQSIESLRKLKLNPHNDQPKNWDCYRAFSFILKHGDKKAKILDVGCAHYGVILQWLELYGFSNLYGCDIAFKKDFQRGKIRYTNQDLQKTNFESASFDFITSISVIEHGVDVDAYFREMGRLLKPGGYLLTSTDYWPEPINTTRLYPYGRELGEMRIFTKNDVENWVGKAKTYALELLEPIDFSYKDKVVWWQRVRKRFTFVFFVLKRSP